MSNIKKQKVAVAAATVLSVSTVVTPHVTVKAQENETHIQQQYTMRSNTPTPDIAGDVEINETNFLDKVFRDWLKQQTYGEDAKITQAEIANITEINI